MRRISWLAVSRLALCTMESVSKCSNWKFSEKDLLWFQGKCRIICRELFRECKAEKLKVVTSRLFYEIRQDELQGAAGFKFPADASFIGHKRPATTTVLREKIKDTSCISLCRASCLPQVVHSKTDYFSPSTYFCRFVLMCLRRTILQVYCEGIFGAMTSYTAERFLSNVKLKLLRYCK
jgi:hypothetical protein